MVCIMTGRPPEAKSQHQNLVKASFPLNLHFFALYPMIMSIFYGFLSKLRILKVLWAEHWPPHRPFLSISVLPPPTVFVQKSALKIILGAKYESYQKALNILDLEPLDQRRDYLCLKFAQKCMKNEKTKQMFPLNEKDHNMDLRKTEKFKVMHANTDRLKKSPIIYMQHLLNQLTWKKKIFFGRDSTMI